MPSSYDPRSDTPAIIHHRCRVNKGWAMTSSPTECKKYWIVYQRGRVTVLVGEGVPPGTVGATNTKLITRLTNDNHAPRGVFTYCNMHPSFVPFYCEPGGHPSPPTPLCVRISRAFLN